MENKAYLGGMLELIPQPAFAVTNGIIIESNQPARMHFLNPGEPIAPLLGENAVAYEEYREGSLSISLTIGSRRFLSTLSRVDGQDIFVLDAGESQSDLQLLQLASGHLRQPLSDLNVFVNKLDQNSPLTGKIKHRLLRLQRLVFNMSDTLRYQNNRFVKPVFVDVCDQIRDWIEHMEVLLDGCGRKLEFTQPREPFFSVIDEEKLERALYNMVSNAIKASAPRDTVHVSLAHDGKQLRLSVRDHGRGIPQAVLPGVYAQYRRTPGAETDGIGLGMTLIQDAAHTHGGTMLVFPQETGGTLVCITIAMQSPKSDRMHSPTLRYDYAGEQDHGLLELSELLPDDLY